jgi:hypothetical protein
MLSSITPLGERSKGNRWMVTVGAHVLGSAVAGAVVGLAAWILGLPLRALAPQPVLLGVVLACTILAAVLEARPTLVPRLPGWRRQVDERWLTAYRGTVYGLGYGVQLGAAVATIVTTAAIPLVLISAAAAPPVFGGVGIGLLFGTARGATVLAGGSIHDGEALQRFHRNFEARADTARRGSSAALAVAALLVAAWAAAGAAS